MSRIKLVQDGEGKIELESILGAVDKSISHLQQSESIDKLVIGEFLDRQIQRLQELKDWQPNE